MNILLFICLLFIVILLYKYKIKLAFTYILAVFWFVNLTVSEVFFTDYAFSNNLYILIIGTIFFAVIGEILGLKNSKINTTINFNNTRFKIIFWIFFSFAFSYPIINLINNGISINRLFSLNQLLEVNNEMAVARYSEEGEKSIIGQLTLIFVYALPLYSSILISFHKKKKYIYLSLLPGFLVIITQNTKLAFISSLLSVFAGIIVQCILIKNQFPKIKIKTLIYSIFGAIAFYVLMVFSFVARIGVLNMQTIYIANSKIASYVAHMPALDNWLKTNDFENMFHSFGVKTFYGITNTLGIAERKAGVFNDFFIFRDSGQLFYTNIYTAYRFLIEDFGFIGTLFFYLLLAFIFTLARRSTKIELKMTILCMLISFIFNSYATSIWAYFSYVLVYFILYTSLKYVLNFKIKLV